MLLRIRRFSGESSIRGFCLCCRKRVTDMSEEQEQIKIHYFVDEAGDPNLFGRLGKIILGDIGCSKYFILGKLDIDDPVELSKALNDLRADLLAEPYFKDVPSMQPERKKTALGFHANNDLPEVRREVFKLLIKPEYDLKFYAVVKNKTDLLTYVKQRNEQEAAYKYKGNGLYDSLTTDLFSSMHKMVDYVDICFAQRGNKTRTKAFEQALKRAEGEFEKRYGIKRPNTWGVRVDRPENEPGLQAVDYFLWALQRFYERKEGRFLELVYPKISEVLDLDRISDGRRGVRYNSMNKLDLGYFGA